MAETEVNRERVASLIERYQERYRPVTVERETVELPADSWAESLDHARDGYDGGAYAWVVRSPTDVTPPSETYVGDGVDRHRALMILPRGDDAWGLPGGGRESGESFEDAAIREVREEAGIDCEITGLWHVRHLEWTSEDEDDDRRTHSFHPFFEAQYADGSISVQAAEVAGAAWFARPPERMQPANERRAADWDPESYEPPSA